MKAPDKNNNLSVEALGHDCCDDLYPSRNDFEKTFFEECIPIVEKVDVHPTCSILHEINSKVSDYLVAKTMINILLALVSFVILWLHDVDFALFWAIVIGLLNYIPYIGSYLGVTFPVVLSFAQFVSWPLTLSLAVFLTFAQFVVGNLVEPRFIGRQVNLSPVVVLVSLSVWMSLWGVPGAILAVPLTSVMAIVFASFDETRFLSILLADQIDD